MVKGTSAAAVDDPRRSTVRNFLEQALKAKKIRAKTADYVIGELNANAMISSGTFFLLMLALGERIQHGTGGTPADDALLIINTIKND
ncbi:MAG: hypothetical protein Q7S50_00220 [bacterium]|nr:hypothetical protein [bacterium]